MDFISVVMKNYFLVLFFYNLCVAHLIICYQHSVPNKHFVSVTKSRRACAAVHVTGRPAGGEAKSGGLFYSFSCLSARLPAAILSAPLSPKSFEPPHHHRSNFSHKLCKSSQLSQLIIDTPSHKCPPPLILPTPPYNASLSLLLPYLMLTAPSFNPSNHSKRLCKRLLQQNSEPLIKCAGSARVGQRFEQLAEDHAACNQQHRVRKFDHYARNDLLYNRIFVLFLLTI